MNCHKELSRRDISYAEQLVEVPTVLSYALLQQQIAEQNIDIPVPHCRRRGQGGLQGFSSGQNSTARFVEQNVDIPVPGGGLHVLPDPGGSSSSAVSRDEREKGFFGLFPELTKVRMRADGPLYISSLRWCTSPLTNFDWWCVVSVHGAAQVHCHGCEFMALLTEYEMACFSWFGCRCGCPCDHAARVPAVQVVRVLRRDTVHRQSVGHSSCATEGDFTVQFLNKVVDAVVHDKCLWSPAVQSSCVNRQGRRHPCSRFQK